ncbi:MAB_1171c family putative transporter [Nocardia carnea]|uniref:MAB_1171c family putative transporter n=1 Tax=Nocardia carnea TaxID=37328 RepID=UPI00245539DC|nr:MAB_1171c family putative transporter [Nocardia carnea]
MTSPVPGLIAWPVLVALILVLAGRWWLLRDTDVQRLANRALTAAVAALLLREGSVQKLLAAILPFEASDTINVARQISFGGILLTVTGIYGIAKLWSGASPEQTWQRQRRYDAIALVATAIILVAGTPARRSDQLIDQAMGWPAVIAWIAFYLPVGAAALLVGRVAVHEMRTADDTTTWKERTVYLVVLGIALAIGLDALTAPVTTASEVLRDQPSGDPHMHVKALTFFVAAIFAGSVVAVPLVSTLLSISGWDRTGRYCRRLRPLWQDLTAAVPEIVLEIPRDRHGRIEPASRLHRMTIEMRDSLMHLKRYSDRPDDLGVTADPHAHARLVAEAIAAKRDGQQPAARTAMPRYDVTTGQDNDLTTDFRQLLALADAWPNARKLITTARSTQPLAG